MEHSSTKMIQLTGGATKRARRSRSKKASKGQKGWSLQSDLIVSKCPDAMAPSSEVGCMTKGYQTPTVVHGAPLSMAYKPVMPQVPESAVAVAASYPAFPQPTPAPASAPASAAQAGGSKATKVILQPSTKSKTVHLAPKGVSKPVPKKSQRARRITLRLQTVKKTQTRTNKIQAAVKDMPIAKVREHLISRKLIKPTSTAPEKVLRQMAVDAHLVAT